MSTSLTRSFVKFALLPFALSIGLSACGAGTEDAREIPQTGLVIRDLVIRDQQAQPDVVIRGVVATGEQQGLVIRDRTDGLGQEVVIRDLQTDGAQQEVFIDGSVSTEGSITVENAWDEGQAVIIRGLVPNGEQQGLVIRDRTDGLGQEVVLQGLVIRD